MNVKKMTGENDRRNSLQTQKTFFSHDREDKGRR